MGRHLCVSVCVFGLWRGPQTKQGISSHRHRSSSTRSLYAKLLFSFAPSCFDNNWQDNVEGLPARVYVLSSKPIFAAIPQGCLSGQGCKCSNGSSKEAGSAGGQYPPHQIQREEIMRGTAGGINETVPDATVAFSCIGWCTNSYCVCAPC